MKNLLFAILCIGTLSSFTNINKKIESEKPAKMQLWKALCKDGSMGGYFECDCTQAQANAIAYIMCN